MNSEQSFNEIFGAKRQAGAKVPDSDPFLIAADDFMRCICEIFQVPEHLILPHWQEWKL